MVFQIRHITTLPYGQNVSFFVISAMMHKRFGFVVKTRAHHAFSLLRNLYEGLVMAGDQNRKVQDLSQLVTLSHYWDR